ncbi:hypothetical protein C6A85_000000103055 [Mycobacterium sp. ITM-2017-0098]|nr:hypothetical protein C6A85_000000103055 [Mycobacterium sp. ITM-2017-0098]
MRRITVAAAAIAIACGSISSGGGAGTAAAQPTATGPIVMPFGQALRRCDFSEFQYSGAGWYGRPTAELRIGGGEVVADVRFATGVPNARYDVRLIQMPRPGSIYCNPGDPGVMGGVLFTDNAGSGATTLRAPIMSGATGAWMSLTRPSPYSQQPDEFYTTDAIVHF